MTSLHTPYPEDNMVIEITPTQSHQGSATSYAYKALTSGYVDDTDLQDLSSRIIKVVCGKGIKLGCANKLSNLKRHLKKQRGETATSNLDHNCKLLSQGLGLPTDGWKVVKFIVVMNVNRGLFDLINKILPEDNYANAMFAYTLGLSEFRLIEVLKALATTGLFDPFYDYGLIDFMNLPQAIISLLLGSKVEYYLNLIEPFIQSKPESELKLRHFGHLECDTLQQFLDISINQSMLGVNVLFYGLPGTGKTELAKVLADKTQSHLIAIKPVGDEVSGEQGRFKRQAFSSNLRLQYLTLVQRLVSPDEKTLLLIDECEDIFEQSISHRGYGKELLHELMERNTIPTIWITNHIDVIPHSCIRRFTYVLNVSIPDNRVMESLMDNSFKGLRVSKVFKHQLATLPELTPAHITNAAFVTHNTRLSGKAAEHNIEVMVKSTLTACGHSTNGNGYKPQLPFSTEYLNIKGGNQAIDLLENSLDTTCDIRTLLVGPPGTGKTAVVEYLANGCNRELVTIRCSDVLGKYVGESEKNIARIFQQASDNNCILFFDEVDSLLLDRGGLNASWEIQQVNELLTQMESFNQPFFAATNFSERLDRAVMRRFDFKLSFNYLTEKQAQNLFRNVTSTNTLSAQTLDSLSLLKLLTPGDFSILRRRQKLNHFKLTTDECLAILTTENNSKPGNRTIGFK
ncbi:AAA ATPase central domain protein [Shewanella halifaxensis HAW-EB4]|uniref:AAA ATPase central domain protein n=1 Tax=Shewanella halifaxensis (strain HAW-EB4) TaxID=458817 RepID=B0TL55_SHEHH|nr:ATP-binding protein [Shewanella halifaxensis]ABZ78600.1 AAA ATPase central domain protein [Shewanella halifaxensis HAW-EB4]